jgi:RNA polymerase sigma factor (sigma-70 family)
LTVPAAQEVHKLVDHLFRHESGKMVSVLTRVFGIANIEVAEDIVQETMYKAITEWRFGRVPENPAAWLYRVAKNKAIDTIRRDKNSKKVGEEIGYVMQSDWALSGTVNNLFLDTEIQDSQLRMIFACCHPVIPFESQITLTLKTLCGFSVAEIAKAFLTTPDTIEKRLYRAKQRIKEQHIKLDVPVGAELSSRLDAVLKTVYLLFNEGYNSSQADSLIRKDVCAEAMRLCLMLIAHPSTNIREAFALMALMCFHAVRFDSRLDDKGSIVLLREQDRSRWSKELIERGNYYLTRSASGDNLTEYHIEAAIAFYHANAPTFEDTNWVEILRLYELLMTIKTSSVILLNRAIALAQVQGPEAALSELQKLQGMEKYYLYHATLGELYKEIRDTQTAKSHFEKAIELTNSTAEKELLIRKMSSG